MIRKKRLGEILIEEQVITLAQLNIALERMKFSKMRLGEQLVRLKMCTERDIVNSLSKQLRIPVVEIANVPIDTQVFKTVPRSLAVECNCFPFQIEGQYLHVAFADPLRLDLVQHLEAKTQRNIKKYIAGQSEIERSIETYYLEDDSAKEIMGNLSDAGTFETKPLVDEKASLEEAVAELETSTGDEMEDSSAVVLRQAAEDRGVITTVNQIIRIAVNSGASDIHFEPQRKTLLVRQRIDGILTELTRLPRSVAPAIVSRIKIVAGLDIAEKRLPQDGKVRATLDKQRDIDLRVSTLPTKYGEKVVIRILDQSKSALSLEKVFVDPKQLEKVKTIIESTQGMILVTGPTGSGKTTTLYSVIKALQSPTTNIVTIEDPIEYELEGINQVQVNHHIGLSFAKILRSILRQDPEVILVGEIRDPETAEVAFQASATGHLVLSTLHTNSTYATISRLMDLNVEPQVVASSVQGILAQRLIRKICPNCRKEYAPDHATIVHYGLPEGTKLYKGEGCEVCNESGYKGRLSVVEIMTMSADLRAAIANRKPEHVIKEIAVKNGMELLYDVGKKFVLQGHTTLDELDRVLETAESRESGVYDTENFADEMLEPSPGLLGDPRFVAGRQSSLPPISQAQQPVAQPRFPEQAGYQPTKPAPAPAPSPPAEARCPSCNETVKPNWKMCPYCGAKLEKPKPENCPSCGEPVKPNWKMCPACGQSLDAPPASTQAAVSSAPAAAAEGVGGRPGDMMTIEGKPRVLVVDDQKSMQKLVTIALKGIDCEVSTADDGLEALDMVKKFRPHLIILDIVMPRMDGLEVCRRLRADVRTAFIPIMMLTSLSDEKSRLKGYVAGTDDYLAKPFVLEEFYTRVRNLLRRTYGYFTEDDQLLSTGQEWDAATEEARERQRMLDRQNHAERLASSDESER
ncbi:MAG: hypothetical protein Kow00107_01570 [Planctomycetota bacterium]